MRNRVLVLVALMVLSVPAFAEGVGFRRLVWNPNDRAGSVVVVLNRGKLHGQLLYGQTTTVKAEGVTVDLRSYAPSGFVTVIVSTEGDPTATVELLTPPEFRPINCAPIFDNKEAVAEDLDGSIQNLNVNRHWQPNQVFWNMASFFSKPANSAKLLSDYTDQVENGSINSLAPPLSCAGQVSPAVAADPQIPPPVDAQAGAPLNIAPPPGQALTALPKIYRHGSDAAPQVDEPVGGDQNQIYAARQRALQQSLQNGEVLPPWKVQEIDRMLRQQFQQRQ